MMSDKIPSWQPYDATVDAPWNLRRAVHLHRRAGFSATWEELQRDLAGSPEQAVARLLAGKANVQRQQLDFEGTAKLLAETAVTSQLDRRLKAAWVYRMLYNPDTLSERLTLVWHNHFATSNRKVNNLALMQDQNDLLRQFGKARFGQLLSAVVHQPAILEWLDADKNVAGHANENLGRELMELFTLGVGNYTEKDVQEAARALTGWKVVSDQFRFDPKTHDAGRKEILSHAGDVDGDGLLKILLANPATAHRLSWRICQMLMNDSAVEPNAIDELTAGLREHELDIAWGIETVVRSRRFFDAGNTAGRIAAPPQYVIGAIRALECFDSNPSTLLLADWMARMGQDLFYPPNVGGWAEGLAWLGSGAIVARANFAAALAGGRLTLEHSAPKVAAIAERHANAADLRTQIAWLGELLFGGLDNEAIVQIERAATQQREANLAPLDAAILIILTRPEAHQC